MRRIVWMIMLSACLLAVAPVVQAQDCSSWTNWDLRGTYTFSGNGYIDLSKFVPGAPSGMIPMTWASAKVWDGAGGGHGWVKLNAGGMQLTITIPSLTYAMQADCSVQETFSMTVKELGGMTLGPISRLFVVVPKPDSLQLLGIFTGSGPGSPLDLLVAQRISMQNW